ncbi:hypothetical protein [Mycobacterium sp. DL592]|uniref:hypothetical protein n=1 Tax=Mycobacterium sp. DL592 TaxID=2675524 RepID=UPI00141E607B|nr:hypothetical protein [Mycobacterium sp. DL592]
MTESVAESAHPVEKARTARRCGGVQMWLGAGALTLGVGAALASGSGVAHADTAGGDSHSSSPKATGSTARAGGAHGAESARHGSVHATPAAASQRRPASAVGSSTVSNSTNAFVPHAFSVSSGPDVAVALFGHTLIQSGSATAVAGDWSIAIAIGPNSTAYAVGGIFNVALAAGGNSTAGAGGKDGLGNDGVGNFDLAVDIGNNTGSLNGAAATLGNFNTAIDIGDNSGFLLGALAFTGNFNTAVNFGNNTGSASGAGAFYGNGNLAITIGNNTNSGTSQQFGGGAQAGQGNGNVAVQLGSNNGDGAVTPYGYGPIAGGANGTSGNHNFAAVVGNNGTAIAGIGFDRATAVVIGSGLTALANFADSLGILSWAKLF